MSEKIKHASLEAELLYLIGQSSTPLTGAELYDRCELADEAAKVSKALANMNYKGKIVRVEGAGRGRYKLAESVPAPAPAAKESKPAATASEPTAAATLGGLPVIDIPRLGDPPTAAPVAEPPAAPAAAPKSESAAALADAIIARIKRDLEPLLRPPVVGDVEVATAPGVISVHVQSMEININVELSA